MVDLGGDHLSGFVRHTSMAIFTTNVIETKRVGAAFAETAIGFTMALANLGIFVAPPIGNGFAKF